MRKKRKKVKSRAVAALILLSVLLAAWLFQARLEGKKPALIFNDSIDAIGISQDISISVADAESGLRRFAISVSSLSKDGGKNDLFNKDFPYAGITKGGKAKSESFNIPVEPGKLGIPDGVAKLRVMVVDYSWRRFFRGNRTYVEKNINIDTKPPQIRVISRTHDLIQGGGGLVVYRVSEPCRESGVRVGDSFYPGYSGHFKDKNIFLAFIALRHNQRQGTLIFAEAVDMAGNRAKAGFSYYIIKKKFKTDVIKISDSFLNWKMPEFATEIPQNLKMSPIDNFLFVNRELREKNSGELKKICKKTDKSMLWDGRFSRLPRSARRAGFADYRIYKYKGKTIDYQTHFGIDLASVAKANVPAANHGRVAGTGVFGIYGKTVVINHGQNLFSLYAHLSQIYAQEGQTVKKGDIIGRTGTTGFAAGDHLHFGMLINGVFVNPGEWWDSVWIEKNISRKIENAWRLSE